MLTSVFSLCLFLLYFILYLFLDSSDISRYFVYVNVKYTPIGYNLKLYSLKSSLKDIMRIIVMSDIFGVDYVTSDIYWRMVSSSYGLCLIKFTYFRFLFNLLNINFLTLVVMRVKLKLIISVFVLACINILFLDLNYFHFEVF